jgi:hypothetical protein
MKPEYLPALLNQLEAVGKHELRLAVGLVDLYGLRPAELAVLEVREGKGYVGTVKHNSSSMGAKAKQPRLVKAIDIAGREGEGDACYSSMPAGW